MDPRDRADAALARARARGAFVVTPEDAVSPMDASSTQQIPRAVVNALDAEQPTEATMVVGGALGRNRNPNQAVPGPQQQGGPQPQTQYWAVTQQAGQQQVTQQQAAQQHAAQVAQQQADTQPLAASGPRPYIQHVRAQQQPPPPQQSASPGSPQSPETPQPVQLDGVVPTVQQPGSHRSSLSRRLEGD